MAMTYRRGKLVLSSLAIAVLFVTPASAKNRPTVDDPLGRTCFTDPSTDKGSGGPITYCCYDVGCLICDSAPLRAASCVWDPAYRARVKGNLLAPNSRLFTPVPPRR